MTLQAGARPVGYIRRSVARRGDPGDISREFQTTAVRALANGDGPTLRIVDQDWGVSADREQTYRRLGFLDLMAQVEAGQVSAIYAYSLDRLARSVQWSARLLDAAEDAGTVIVTGEGRFDPTNDRDRQMAHFAAMQNEGALRAMKAKAQSTVDTRRARGDRLGQRPYGEVRTRKYDGAVIGAGEDPAVIVAAWREAGSFHGAARLLNDRGIPTQSGRGQWYARMVQRLINRHEPGSRRATRPGVRSLGARPLAGILRCHCGALMGQTTSHGSPKYRCPRGGGDANHGPWSVAEPKLLPWVQDEAARLRIPARVEQVVREASAETAALEEDRRRVGVAFIDRVIDEPTYRDRLAAIDAALAQVEASTRIVEVPAAIPWGAEPATINAILRILFERIELGPDMLPARAVWKLPAEYIAPA